MEMLTGNGMPSKRLDGEIGQHYKDLDTGDIYECKFSKEHSPIHGKLVGGNVWKRIATGDHMEVCAGGAGSGSSAGGTGMLIVRVKDGSTGTANMSYDEVRAATINETLPVCCFIDSYSDGDNVYTNYYIPETVVVREDSIWFDLDSREAYFYSDERIDFMSKD